MRLSLISEQTDHPYHPLAVEDGLVGFGPFAEPSLLQRMLGESSRGLVKSRRMRRMGIIEECCKNTCSYEEMKNYCL